MSVDIDTGIMHPPMQRKHEDMGVSQLFKLWQDKYRPTNIPEGVAWRVLPGNGRVEYQIINPVTNLGTWHDNGTVLPTDLASQYNSDMLAFEPLGKIARKFNKGNT